MSVASQIKPTVTIRQNDGGMNKRGRQPTTALIAVPTATGTKIRFTQYQADIDTKLRANQILHAEQLAIDNSNAATTEYTPQPSQQNIQASGNPISRLPLWKTVGQRIFPPVFIAIICPIVA